MARIVFVLALFALASPAAAEADYLAELKRSARAQSLAEDPYWHSLLHYEKRLGGVTSEVETGGFFLAEGGRTDPRAELDATLAAFFEPAAEDGAQHPQCRFIARYHWLKSHLDFDPERLTERDCPDYRQWYNRLNPHRLTLVFASAYLGNPASMFGHTLLRIDQPGGQDGQLASFALNHAAQTDERSGVVFAARGLTGGYFGEYAVMPYYQKVRVYNDLENRDMWEYELAFEPAEVDRIIRHTWELRDTGFRYYFFLQNCSYRLLELMELARPGLELTDTFDAWAIPTDTVREVLEIEGLLADVRFRPSEATTIHHHLADMTVSQRRLAHGLAVGGREPDAEALRALAPGDRARALQVAYDYLRYRMQDGQVDPEEVRPRLRSLLVARSEITQAEPLPAPEAPDVRPDQGHGTARVAFGGGTRDGESFQSLRLRPAYHGLLDPPGGYRSGAQINLADLELRRRSGDRLPTVEEADLASIESVAPRNRFFSPVSWNVRLGIDRQLTGDGDRPVVGGLEGGAALAYELGRDTGVIGFAGWQASAQVGTGLPDDWRLGTGPRAGMLIDAGAAGRSRLEARSLWHVDEDDVPWRLSAEHRVPLWRNGALGLRLMREHAFDRVESEVGVSLYIYL